MATSIEEGSLKPRQILRYRRTTPIFHLCSRNLREMGHSPGRINMRHAERVLGERPPYHILSNRSHTDGWKCL